MLLDKTERKGRRAVQTVSRQRVPESLKRVSLSETPKKESRNNVPGRWPYIDLSSTRHWPSSEKILMASNYD